MAYCQASTASLELGKLRLSFRYGKIGPDDFPTSLAFILPMQRQIPKKHAHQHFSEPSAGLPHVMEVTLVMAASRLRVYVKP